jgi:hypothetical protein
MMSKEEELKRVIKDRDMAENDAHSLEQELSDFEFAHPDDYQDYDEWNNLDYEIRALENEAMYLTHVIESLKEELGDE